MKRKIVSIILCLLLALAIRAPAQAAFPGAGEAEKRGGEKASDTEYKAVLEDTLDNIRATVTDPECGSVGGEWAVLALARGGYVDEAWYGRYLDSLSGTVDECRGVLSQRQYTEYSRVIIGLTAAGLDATAFDTGSGVYDLVSPLLNKQKNGDYWASWQGNNGTIFALIALNTHDYLPETGLQARADLLDEILKVQLASGAWEISSGSGADIDVTAMAIQALAPYYRSKAKFDALGATHTYQNLTDSVEDGLSYLKTRKKNDYGSVEAAAQVAVALAALDRDAAKDALLGDVLGSVLSYYNGNGGFVHDHSGGSANQQMSTEQAAYALVAYDRWKNGKTSLYDMTDRRLATTVKVDATSAAVVRQVASGKLTVTCEEACAVIAVMADGSYYRLKAEGTGNTRTFHTVQRRVIVRLLGDYDGDDSVETLDLAKANKALLGSGVGALEALIMGADNGCELETVDLARLNKKLINDTKFDW